MSLVGEWDIIGTTREARTQCSITRTQRHENLCVLAISQVYNYAVLPWLILLFLAEIPFPAWNSHLLVLLYQHQIVK